jgi:hypothetical protein
MYYNEERVDISYFSLINFLRERPTMKETAYQTELMKKIKALIPDSLVIRNDPRYIQGFPDLIVLYKNMWAALEVKVSSKASFQPNQQYFIKRLGAMSFASVINPDNEGEVLSELQRSFRITRKTRVSQSK